GDPGEEARQRGVDRRRVRDRVRRRLPHADERRTDTAELAGAGGPSCGAARGRAVSETDLAMPFRERADAALQDGFLQQALTIATTKFIDLRREAFGEFPEGDVLRDRARAIKEATLQHLDRHLEQLIENVERLGGHVHFATTPEDARRIILDIAARTGTRMVVKSKSMATEEIHLNEALEAAGVTPVETDLGEYIIQLAHERPSHIIAPAIHKTKGQVAVMGVGKVVPSMTDLAVFLAILAKSATGQKLSVYTTLVRGPRKADELEGPDEFHLVLLDNGRIDQIGGTLREALDCLRCGA